ncbi:MAG TPA: helix-turn-helix domain-containing protein, partial [Pseudonocardiaceae bacterium]
MTARRSSATTSTTTAPPTRRVRADAKRNYERLLTAARDAFTEHGTEASLDAIAQQAGVGNATLYRHFPTRETLLEAVLHERFEQLAAHEQTLLSAPDPACALASWLTEFVDYTKTFH